MAVDVPTEIEHSLSQLVGAPLARTVMRRALAPGTSSPTDGSSLRTFLDGPLVETLSPLIGRFEAARFVRRVEADVARAREWPIDPLDELHFRRKRQEPPGSNEL